MGFLGQGDDAEGFAQSHAVAGWNRAVRRCMRLRALLERACANVWTDDFRRTIDDALSKSISDESDAPLSTGEWRGRS